jgi:hypothetical protein
MDGLGWAGLGSGRTLNSINFIARCLGAWIRPDRVAEAIFIIVHRNKSLFNITALLPSAWQRYSLHNAIQV